MASGVEELLDMLFEMIDEAKNAAFTSDKCVIERDRALDLIDDIRSQFPIELAEAQKIMANRNELMASAKREAEAKAMENPFPYAQPNDGDKDGNPFTDN